MLLFVRQCEERKCRHVTVDPENKLDPFNYNSWCKKCHSSWMEYRQATIIEKFRYLVRLIDIYKPED